MEQETGLEELAPNDEAAEWNLLACLIHKPELIPGVRTELLYQENGRRALLKMQQFWLEKRGCLKSPELFEHELFKSLEGHCYEPLNRALNSMPPPDNWSFWLAGVEQCWKARRLLGLVPMITEAAGQLQNGNTDPLEGLRQKFGELENNSVGLISGRSMNELVPLLIDELDKLFKSNGALQGITTGLSNLNKVTNGLQDGRFYIFAGRPGEGKSSLLLQLTHAAADSGRPVVYFSLEMPAEELGLRLLASLSRVVTGKFARGTASEQDFERVSAATLVMKNLPVTIVDSTSALHDIISQANRMCSGGKTKMIVLDYLQRVRIPGYKQNRNELVTEVSNAMKDLAMSLKVPVIAAAQLNRSVTKENRPPNLADLRDSGSLEQDADFVGLLHSTSADQTQMCIAKNRSGEMGSLTFHFRREITRFETPL